ncbi:hypothetical protein P3T21_007382 [Paraburkholderia sp. GAS334]
MRTLCSPKMIRGRSLGYFVVKATASDCSSRLFLSLVIHVNNKALSIIVTIDKMVEIGCIGRCTTCSPQSPLPGQISSVLWRLMNLASAARVFQTGQTGGQGDQELVYTIKKSGKNCLALLPSSSKHRLVAAILYAEERDHKFLAAKGTWKYWPIRRDPGVFVSPCGLSREQPHRSPGITAHYPPAHFEHRPE